MCEEVVTLRKFLVLFVVMLALVLTSGVASAERVKVTEGIFADLHSFDVPAPLLPPGVAGDIEPAVLEYVSVDDVLGKISVLGFSAADFKAGANGEALLADDVALEAVKAATGKDQDAFLLPVFQAQLTNPGKVAAVGFSLEEAQLYGIAEYPQDLLVVKVFPDKSVDRFYYAGTPEEFGDKAFTLLYDDGKFVEVLEDSDEELQLVLFIKDGGEFDLYAPMGMVVDPTVLTRAVHSKSGGCDAGFGFAAVALLGAVALVAKKRK